MFNGGEGGEVEESTHTVGKDAYGVVVVVVGGGEGEGGGGGDDDGCEKEEGGSGDWWNGLIIFVIKMRESQGVAKDTCKKANSR